jgi:hypothetical protein
VASSRISTDSSFVTSLIDDLILTLLVVCFYLILSGEFLHSDKDLLDACLSIVFLIVDFPSDFSISSLTGYISMA